MACGQHNRILAEERREIIGDALRKLEEEIPQPTVVFTEDDPLYGHQEITSPDGVVVLVLDVVK